MKKHSGRLQGSGLWASLGIACVLLALSGGSVLAAHVTVPKAGFSLDYPDPWQVNTHILALDGPLFLTNFPPGEYRHGGHLPPGGIEINVLALPATEDEDRILVPGVPASSSKVTKSTQTIATRPVRRADFDFHFDDRTTYPATSLVVRMPAKVFRILVTYEHVPSAQDKAGVEAALSQIVSSLSTSGTR